MATVAIEEELFSYAEGAVKGFFTVQATNGVAPSVGDAVTSARLVNNGATGTLFGQVFQRNSDGSLGPSLFGPFTVHVNSSLGPFNLAGQNLKMIGVPGPKGTTVEEPFIAMTSWSSS